jgi:hypothetical protein
MQNFEMLTFWGVPLFHTKPLFYALLYSIHFQSAFVEWDAPIAGVSSANTSINGFETTQRDSSSQIRHETFVSINPFICKYSFNSIPFMQQHLNEFIVWHSLNALSSSISRFHSQRVRNDSLRWNEPQITDVIVWQPTFIRMWVKSGRHHITSHHITSGHVTSRHITSHESRKWKRNPAWTSQDKRRPDTTVQDSTRQHRTAHDKMVSTNDAQMMDKRCTTRHWKMWNCLCRSEIRRKQSRESETIRDEGDEIKMMGDWEREERVTFDERMNIADSELLTTSEWSNVGVTAVHETCSQSIEFDLTWPDFIWSESIWPDLTWLDLTLRDLAWPDLDSSDLTLLGQIWPQVISFNLISSDLICHGVM